MCFLFPGPSKPSYTTHGSAARTLEASAVARKTGPMKKDAHFTVQPSFQDRKGMCKTMAMILRRRRRGKFYRHAFRFFGCKLIADSCQLLAFSRQAAKRFCLLPAPTKCGI